MKSKWFSPHFLIPSNINQEKTCDLLIELALRTKITESGLEP
jgi:hypothetical protein